jgi:DNA-binding response OmpR family regulator
MKTRILLVEDDSGLSATLLERLQIEGYEPVLATTKAEAQAEFEAAKSKGGFDLLLLDIGLPDGSGLDFARDVRLNSAVPIVFLSAMNSAGHRLEGFEIGAEDYIPKPFHLKELLLRIRKVFSHSSLQGTISFGVFTVDLESRKIAGINCEPVFMGAKDFDVLRYLIEAYPRVISRQELLKNVWKEGEESQSGRTVDNSIVRLRQQLNPFSEECIRSVRGIGYQWMLERGVAG